MHEQAQRLHIAENKPEELRKVSTGSRYGQDFDFQKEIYICVQ